jgi:signal transduction histidine kinase
MGAWATLPLRPMSTLAGRDWQALVRHISDLPATWRTLNLVQRYVVISLTSLAVFSAVASVWLARQPAGAPPLPAAAEALVLDVVAPLVQGLGHGAALPSATAAAFDNLMTSHDVASKVAALNLRRLDGTLLYSSAHAAGSAPFSLSSLPDRSTPEEAGQSGIQQTGVPIYKSGSREVIAVAELSRIVGAAPGGGYRWVALAALALAMLAVPFRLVQGASARLAEQQQELGAQKTEVARLNARNEALRKLVELIHRRGMEHNERLLRRIGSDLHDGPAQHLALVLLRLDELAPALAPQSTPETGSAPKALETIRRATSDALREIRHISSGLALPELQKISLKDALLIAVRAHERATGTAVDVVIDELPARLPLPMTICLYRFAQEALNNAFRHAEGKGQSLSARYDGVTISVEISDTGPGFSLDQTTMGDEHLGLAGLRYRVESLGGSLQINSQAGRGTRLMVHFRNPLAPNK